MIHIPANHNVTGTCGECGGPIILPMTSPISTNGHPPQEWCLCCGCVPKPIAPTYGPVRQMQESRPAWPRWPASPIDSQPP